MVKKRGAPSQRAPAPSSGKKAKQSPPDSKESSVPKSPDQHLDTPEESDIISNLEAIYEEALAMESSDDDDDDAPEIRPEPSTVGKDRILAMSDAQLLKSLKTWSDCTDACPAISTAHELREWTRQQIFRIPIRYLLEGHLWPQQISSVKRVRGVDFTTIMSVVREDNRSGEHRLTLSEVDRSPWTQTDWYASTLERIFKENKSNVNGLFRGHRLSEDRQYIILYSIMACFLKDCSPSRLHRTWRYLEYSEEKERDLRRQFPRVKEALVKTDKAALKAARTTKRTLLEEAKKTLEKLPENKLKELQARDEDRAKRSSLPTGSRYNVSDSHTDQEYAPTPIGSSPWRQELRNPRQPKFPQKQSPTFDISDPYWQSRLIRNALDTVDRLCAQDTSEVDYTDTPIEEPDEGETLLPDLTIDNLTDLPDPDPQTIPSPVIPVDSLPDADIEDLAGKTDNVALFNDLNHLLREGPAWANELEEAMAKTNSTKHPTNYTGSTAQDTSDNTLMPASVIEPSTVDLKNLDDLDMVFDNEALQRDDLDKAASKLNATPAGDMYKLPGMRPSMSLKRWQLLGAHAMTESFDDPMLSGHLNADDVGLGKTWSTIGFLVKNWERFEGPILIVVPPHLIYQWADEIQRATSLFKLWILYGDARDKKLHSKHEVLMNLTNDHPMFKEEHPGSNIVLTSYNTLVSRHGINLLREWQTSHNRPVSKKGEPDLAWPKCFYKMFGCMVLDEAHTIRNSETSAFKTITLNRAKFHVLLTATPAFNVVDNVRGMLTLLLNEENEKWWDNVQVPKDFSPLLPGASSNEHARLLFTIRGLDHWIWNSNLSSIAKGAALAPVWERCVIRRLVTSRIPFKTGPRIGDEIPPLCRKVLDVSFTGREQTEYNMFSLFARKHLVSLDRKTKRRIWRADHYRTLQMLGTWTASRYTKNVMRAEDIETMDKQLDENGTFGKRLAHIALKTSQRVHKLKIKNAKKNGEPWEHMVDSIHQVPRKYQDLDRAQALCYLLIGAPKLREWLRNVHHELFYYQEKSVTWTANPGQQFMAAAINLCGISVGVYHSKLSHLARNDLVERFNKDPDSIHCVINSYLLGVTGINFQHGGRSVHLLALPFTIAMLLQALGRSRRVGARRIVLCIEYRLQKSFDLRQLSLNISKALPGLAMQIKNSQWSFSLDQNDSGEMEIKLEFPWLKNADGSFSTIRAPLVPYIDPGDFIAADALLSAFITAHSSSTKFQRPTEAIPDAVQRFLENPETPLEDGTMNAFGIYALEGDALTTVLANHYTKFAIESLDAVMTDA